LTVLRPASSMPHVARSGGTKGATTSSISTLSTGMLSTSSFAAGDHQRGSGLFGDGGTDFALQELEGYGPSTQTPLANSFHSRDSTPAFDQPAYAAVHGLPKAATALSHPNRFGRSYYVVRNESLSSLWVRIETLLSTAGEDRVNELAGTKPGMELDPTNLKATILLRNGIITWQASPDRLASESVCPVEALRIFNEEDEEIILKGIFLEFELASLHRAANKTLFLRHFLPRDSKGNWPEMDSPANLLLAIRGIGHWLYFILRWEHVVTGLMDEINREVFNRYTVRYFAQELYNALASIPVRAAAITVLASSTEAKHMNAFVDRLKEIKTRMTKDGSETLYLTLPHKSPGGPGVDTLIGTMFAALAPPAAPAAAVIAHPPAVVTAPPASQKGNSRSRDRDRHRRDSPPRRQQQQNGRNNGNGRDNNYGRDNDRRDSRNKYEQQKVPHGEFCLEDFMDVLNVRKAPCIYGEDCRNKHLTRAGNTRSLAQVERQVMEELRGNEGARLMEALRTHAKSPFAHGHSSSK
jgi:hypothetical protein